MQLNLRIIYRVFEGNCAGAKILRLFLASEVLVIWPLLIQIISRVFEGDLQYILIDVQRGVLTFLFDLER